MSDLLVVHLKRDPYDIRVDRQTKWGNPFSHLDKPTAATYVVPTLDDALKCFDNHFINSPELRVDIGELTGKILGCWCAPKGGLPPALPPDAQCHGQILAWYANKE